MPGDQTTCPGSTRELLVHLGHSVRLTCCLAVGMQYIDLAEVLWMPNTSALVLFSVLLAVGQVLFKYAAQTISGQTLETMIPTLSRSIPMWAAVLLYGASTVLWVWILSRVPLSRAYPWVALATIIVPLAATIFFGEVIKPIYWVGAVMVAIGIGLTQIGSTG